MGEHKVKRSRKKFQYLWAGKDLGCDMFLPFISAEVRGDSDLHKLSYVPVLTPFFSYCQGLILVSHHFHLDYYNSL